MTISVLLLVLLGATPASADSVVERGRYLVEVLGACSNCHSPKGMAGELPGTHMAGGLRIEEEFGVARPAISPPVR